MLKIRLMMRFDGRMQRRRSSVRHLGIERRLRLSGTLTGSLQRLMDASQPLKKKRLARSSEPGDSGSLFLLSLFHLRRSPEIIGGGDRLLRRPYPRPTPHGPRSRPEGCGQIHRHRYQHGYWCQHRQSPRIFRAATLYRSQSRNHDTHPGVCTGRRDSVVFSYRTSLAFRQ